MIVTKIHAGLGNQLFQYATGRALSIHLNTELKLDLTFYDNLDNKNAYRLNRFNLETKQSNNQEFEYLRNVSNVPFPYRVLKKLGIRRYPYFKNTHILEQEIIELLNSSSLNFDNYYLEGWFANENYFKDYRSTIIFDLNADFLLVEANLNMQHEIKNSNSVSVHIRRGDYLSNSYFKTLPITYYKNAIEKIKVDIDTPKFFFFSNDIEWTKNNFKDVQNAIFIEKNSKADTSFSTTGDIEDLMLMRSCKHNIIANSTFSWWGAWLNENPSKKVYFPSGWYNDAKAQKQFEKNSFIPSGWIKIQFK